MIRTRRVTADTARVLIGCLLLALCATCIAGYRYGVSDQVQYLVQVIANENPAELAGDPYLEVFPWLRSEFWRLVGVLTTESSRPLVCLVLTVLTNAVNAFILVGLGATLLGGSRPWSWPLFAGSLAVPLVLVVPKERVVEYANRAMSVLETENRLRGEIRQASSLAELAELLRWEKK